MSSPSWAVDFSRRPSTQSQVGMLFTSLEDLHVEGNSLYARGIRIGIIETLLECSTNNTWSFAQDTRMVGELLQSIDLNAVYVTGGTLLEAVARSLILNEFAEEYEPYYTYKPSKHILLEPLSFTSGVSLSTPDQPDDELTDYRSALDPCHGKSVFFTKMGHVGTCSRFAQAGDIVVYLVDCNTSMVLRRRSLTEYLVVSSAYCHGVMGGEPFLGELPSEVERVWHTKYQAWVFRKRGDTRSALFTGSTIRGCPRRMDTVCQ